MDCTGGVDGANGLDRAYRENKEHGAKGADAAHGADGADGAGVTDRSAVEIHADILGRPDVEDNINSLESTNVETIRTDKIEEITLNI